MARHTNSDMMPRAVLGIASSSSVHVLDAFDSGQGRPTQSGDRFALFSVTKPIVGMAIMAAVERGQIVLGDELAPVLDGFGKQRTTSVRLEHLLTHTSGVVEQTLSPAGGLRDDLLAQPFAFEAGAMWQYSSLAYYGAQLIFEAGTGLRLSDQVSALAQESLAGGLSFEPEGFHPVVGMGDAIDFDHFTSLRHPGAGLFGTASDLLGLGQTVLRILDGERSFLSNTTLSAMLRPRTSGKPQLFRLPNNDGTEYGITWRLRQASRTLLEPDIFGHGGWSGVEWWIYPSRDLVVVMMTNLVDPLGSGVDIDQLLNIVAAEAS